jgi:RNA polymerase sigma factor (sigma-70 family)
MAEVLVRQEPSTLMPGKPVGRSASTAAPAARRPRRSSAATGCEHGTKAAESTLLDVLIDNRPALVQLAQELIGCASLAEDVVHDVFIKLVDFRQQGAVRQPVAYVTRIVHNAAIDVCRRQSQDSGDEHAACACDDDLHAPSPEAALVARDTLQQVFDALNQLPPRSRTAFEMVRVREETLQHTARALDVSQSQVHFMVRDAQQHCVDCLDASNRGVAGPAYCGSRVRRR